MDAWAGSTPRTRGATARHRGAVAHAARALVRGRAGRPGARARLVRESARDGGGSPRREHPGDGSRRARPSRAGARERQCSRRRAPAGPSTQEAAVHHEEWWRAVPRRPPCGEAGRDLCAHREEHRRRGGDERCRMRVDERALGGLGERGSGSDAAAVALRRARPRVPRGVALGMARGRLAVPVASGQRLARAAAGNAYGGLSVRAPARRPDGGQEREHGDQEPTGKASRVGAGEAAGGSARGHGSTLAVRFVRVAGSALGHQAHSGCGRPRLSPIRSDGLQPRGGRWRADSLRRELAPGRALRPSAQGRALSRRSPSLRWSTSARWRGDRRGRWVLLVAAGCSALPCFPPSRIRIPSRARPRARDARRPRPGARLRAREARGARRLSSSGSAPPRRWCSTRSSSRSTRRGAGRRRFRAPSCSARPIPELGAALSIDLEPGDRSVRIAYRTTPGARTRCSGSRRSRPPAAQRRSCSPRARRS